MRKFTGVLIACAAGLVLVATAIAGLNSNKSVHLSGDLEVPANASAGQGQASFHLSEDGTSVDYKLNVANIENVIVAHIHMGTPGVNGPVGVFLYPSSSPGTGPARWRPDRRPHRGGDVHGRELHQAWRSRACRSSRCGR